LARELNLYVSASPEMDPECELLGQMLAQLTQSIRWTIKRTPGPHLHMDPDWEALAASHLYVILLGSDISAPVGVEYRTARQQGIATFRYRRAQATPTPALSAFVRQMNAEWHVYQSPQAFAQDLRQRLIRELIDGTPGYGLAREDIEALAALLKAEDSSEAREGEERRGAGQGGIILPNIPQS
jgi:hypothetical protein